MNKPPRRRVEILSPDVVNTRQNPETMERELIFGMIKSYLFYRQAKEFICPLDMVTGAHRRDFTVDRYNDLFRAIAARNRFCDMRPAPPNDVAIPLDSLAESIIDWGKENAIPDEVARKLAKELIEEAPLFAAITREFCSALIQSEGFKDWLERRKVALFMDEVTEKRRQGTLTEEDLNQKWLDLKRDDINAGKDFVRPRDVIRGTISFSPAISTGLPKLDRALGGGIRLGEVTLVAGINAGGKTVLAQQLAYYFAFVGHKVAVFTTEESPLQYVLRMVSNITNTEYGNVLNRRDIPDVQKTVEEVLTPNIPAWMWEDPEVSRKLEDFEEVTNARIKFVDWSRGQGYSIPQHFEPEIDKLMLSGWSPDVVIFDWIGGGLEITGALGEIRHRYQEAVDFLVAFGKKSNCAIIALAQLNKTKVTPSTKKITGDMLSECLTMTNNVANFIGISSLREDDGDNSDAGKPRLKRRQYFYVDKCRNGPGGLAAVEQHFNFQRFV